MKKLVFSHDYEKLPLNWEGTQATLIGVLDVFLNQFKLSHPQLISRDTKFRGEKGSYDLTFDDALLLTFFHFNTGILFTTIRRWTEGKAKYYHESIGETFTLIRTS